MSLRILRAGPLTTVQDLGRPGWRQYAVPPGGAVDALSLMRANWLVANPDDDPGLEITLQGPLLEFTKTAWIALTGARMKARIGSEWLPQDRPLRVAPDTVVDIGRIQQGCRAYLAVAGGISVPPVLGGRGTYLAMGLGGHRGRSLRAGDELSIAARRRDAHCGLYERMASGKAYLEKGFETLPWHLSAGRLPACNHVCVLRVLAGRDRDLLSPAARSALFESVFTVTPHFDRMGYRLHGPKLGLVGAAGCLSTPVDSGTIQVPPDGRPILLMADSATTGGYAKVAHVISADMDLASQLPPQQPLRFQCVSLQQAHALYRRQQRKLARLKQGVLQHWQHLRPSQGGGQSG